MLNTLRKHVSGWLAKFLLGILVLSFAVWGVADVFRGYGTRTLATVGSRTITPEEYSQAYETELYRIQMQFGQRLSREQARAFGLEGQVLSRLVRDAVVDEHARGLGLGLTDRALIEAIQRDPMFKGPDGSFSRLAFEQVLRANGLREGTYLARQRALEVREQIMQSVIAQAPAPAAAVQALHRYQEEQRTLAYLIVPEAKAGTIPEPDEAKIKAYHEANPGQFSWPEYRRFALLTVTPDTLKKPDAVGEDEVKKAFEERKASFDAPEKRTIQQIAFKDMAAAEKAHKELKAGKDFLAVAREQGLKDSDVDLGQQTKSAMVDKAIAEAAFAAKKGEVSRPVQGTFALVIVRATEVTPAIVKTYEQVKGELRDTLAREKAIEEVQALQDKVENARGRGSSLKEIAEKNGLRLTEIAGVDRIGNGPDGKPVAGILEQVRVLAKAFEAKEPGADIEAIDLQGGGSVWLELQGITPQKLKPLDEVRAAVREAYLASEQRKALSELARKLVERLNKGETIEAVAKEQGVKVETSKPLKRADKSEPLPPSAIGNAFAIQKHAAAWAETADQKSRVVFKVSDIIVPAAPDKESADKLAREIGTQMAGDLAAQYLGALQARYGVNVNEATFKRVTGQGGEQ
jgi:peptidyl-prolyl cis-trans isomerase D